MKSNVVGQKISIGSKTFDVVNYIILLLIAFVTLYPMYYIFIVSISSGDFISRGLISFIPRGITWEAYKLVFKNQDIWRSYINTIIYTGVGTLINVMVTALCAFPLSRRDFYGRSFFTVLITITMFISGGLIPLYLVVNQLHMTNTIWAIVLPPAVSTYNMIIMRTFFSNVPFSLQESAYLDGANDLHIFFKIILPLSTPIIATLTLFYAVAHWNSFFPALIYLNEKSKYPVQIILRDIVVAGEFSEQGGDITNSMNIVAVNFKYAAIIIAVVPILAVYPFLQKYFAKGVMVGAVKG
jgi:putative aldouronate transport system permease protein